MAPRSHNKKLELKGFCLPKDQKPPRGEAEDSDDEEQQEEDEEEKPEFLDSTEMNSVSSGGFVFNSPTRQQTVKVQDFNGKVHHVDGRFPLRDPWWEVTCMLAADRRKTTMKGFPFYKLRSDLDKDVMSLFLKACGVHEHFVSGFFDWLPKEKIVTFDNLAEIIEEFSEDVNKDHATMIATSLSLSDAGKQVYAALTYPNVVKYLPNLLPRQFIDLLKKVDRRWIKRPAPTQAEQEGDEEEDGSFLARLERITAEEVWKLGFSEIVKRELKLVRCEASLRSFQDCGLWEEIPELQQDGLKLYDFIKKTCYKKGSTYLTQEKLCKEFPSVEQAWDAIQFLREQKVVVVDKEKVVLQSFHSYESGIAQCLGHLVENRAWHLPLNATEVLQAAAENRRQTSEEPSDADTQVSPIKLDEDQVRAAERICANPVTIISGKAGCGKTSVVSQLFKAAVQGDEGEQRDIQEACEVYANDQGGSLSWDDPPMNPGSLSPRQEEEERRPIRKKEEILLTAPTGRAASLLSRKTGFSAYTLHQVLFSYMSYQRRKTEVPDKPWKFQDVSVLVVDEGSMVPVWLLHTVLNLLISHAQLRKLVILGDIRQLPSIQPGNVLTDLFDSLKRLHWAVEMKTNHRAESQLIVHNAGIIADSGQRGRYCPLEFDAKVVIDGSPQELPDDKRFILVQLPENPPDDVLQQAVMFLINTAPGLKDHSTSQFIAFTNADVDLINELCCKHYNNHITKYVKNNRKKLLFCPGDKVCCTKNGYVQDVADENAERLQEAERHRRRRMSDLTQMPQEVKEKEADFILQRLCNGEIYFITEDKTVISNDQRKHRYLTLDDGDGRELTVEFRQLQRECKLKHAWARTIHTFQGSENETIVYVVGSSSAQIWKHIYTAVTRGQKRVYVVTKKSAMENTITRKEIPRQTRLQGLVKEQVVRPWMEVNSLPGTPSSCNSTPAQPMPSPQTRPQTAPRAQAAVKRLWAEDKKEGEEAAPSSRPQNGSSDPRGAADAHAAEHQVPCKQPRVTEAAAAPAQ